MPRSQEVQKRNFYESMFAPNIKIQSTVNTTLDNVLDESIDVIPYSSTSEKDSDSHLKVESTLKEVYSLNKFGEVGDLYVTARWLLAMEVTGAENCGGIALDAHYRCKEKGLDTNILSLANEDGSQQHVVLTFESKGKSYIFDTQHGYVYPMDKMKENLKLWDSNKNMFVSYNEEVHKAQKFLDTFSLEEVDKAKQVISEAKFKYENPTNLNIQSPPHHFTIKAIEAEKPKASQSSNKESNGCVIC
ncbi:MAG: hypothetical protein EP298_06170 [Gammaproteobacteria bacterium]|nr:MAG: hypothetical protein EP298_06170 [Gammaproteobacteria bacterium]UTW41455.1 hypothetical protein KFE69_08000 [bacterium SCSIO 12844]